MNSVRLNLLCVCLERDETRQGGTFLSYRLTFTWLSEVLIWFDQTRASDRQPIICKLYFLHIILSDQFQTLHGCYVHWQIKSHIQFNHLLPQHVIFPGSKMHAHTCKRYIFRFYSASTFTAMRFNEMSFHMLVRKRSRKGLRVCTLALFSWSFSSDIIAVKGLMLLYVHRDQKDY